MKKFLLRYNSILLVLLLLPLFSWGQDNKMVVTPHTIDSLKNVVKTAKDGSNKIDAMNGLTSALSQVGSYDSALVYSKKTQLLSEKIGYNDGLAICYTSRGTIYGGIGNFKSALECYFKALSLAKKIEDKKDIAKILMNVGNIYGNEGSSSQALEYYLEALSVFQEARVKECISLDMGNIANIYSEEGNYPKALEYYFKSIAMSEEIGDKSESAINLGNIGNIYHFQYNYPAALEYHFKALAITKEIGDKDGTAVELGNIGEIFDDRGDYAHALQYCLQALNMSTEVGDQDDVADNLYNIGVIYYNQANYPKALGYHFKALLLSRNIGDKAEMDKLYIGIGGTYLKQKDYNMAGKFLDSAIHLSQGIGDKKLTENAYESLAKLDSATGNYKAAYEDHKKYMVYYDSIVNTESVNKITQLEVGYDFQKREDSIKAVQEKNDIVKRAEIRHKTVITNSAIVIALLTIILALMFINNEQVKRKKDKIIFEKEKQLIEEELSKAKTTLDGFILGMEEKNKLLEEFKVDVEKLTKLKAKEIDDQRVENIEYLNKATILTEDDWDKFKELYEQVYKGFFIRLKEKLPELTQSEVRFVCLTKLKLGTKQMAGIIGVSNDTIKISRYRLRKKLNLQEEASLDELVESI